MDRYDNNLNPRFVAQKAGTAFAVNTSPVNLHANETETALAANVIFVGAARDTGAASGAAHAYNLFRARASITHASTLHLEYSWDGAAYFPSAQPIALAPATAGTLEVFNREVPLIGRYQRARLVNGITAQTATRMDTSLAAV